LIVLIVCPHRNARHALVAEVNAKADEINSLKAQLEKAKEEAVDAK
jgi:hypothetical protein